jgi:hypothetical protein
VPSRLVGPKRDLSEHIRREASYRMSAAFNPSTDKLNPARWLDNTQMDRFVKPDADQEAARARKREYAAAYRAANRVRLAEKQRAYYQQNRDACITQAKAYAAGNRERVNENSRRWRERNKAKVLALTNARRAAKDQRTPAWDAELTALAVVEAHDLATRREAVTGFSWHVDHVIPLRGKTVCGLHVWSNLAVIPAAINVRKNNKLLDS